MKNSIFSILAVAAAVNAGKVISTLYETEVYTVTSCLPEVTECAGKETSTVHTYTTECDETDKPYPTPVISTKYPDTTAYPVTTSTKEPEYTTSTVYETKEYTVTSCAPTVTNCPVGAVTTTVIASTTVCPVETGKPYPPPKEDEHKPYPPPKESEHTTYPPPVETTTEGQDEYTKPYPPPAVTTTKGQDEYTKPYPPPAVETPTGPQLSTITIETCVPTQITKVITVTEEPKPTKPAGEVPPTYPGITTVETSPYGTAPIPKPTGGYAYPPKNETVPFTGSANTQRAGGLLFAVGLAVALL